MTAALRIEHLNKYFGKKQILHDISFETYPGEVFGFLGPNGAGKTTTIKIAVGHLRLDDGDILINGQSITSEQAAHTRLAHWESSVRRTTKGESPARASSSS